jgi:hypothetical protein
MLQQLRLGHRMHICDTAARFGFQNFHVTTVEVWIFSVLYILVTSGSNLDAQYSISNKGSDLTTHSYDSNHTWITHRVHTQVTVPTSQI